MSGRARGSHIETSRWAAEAVWPFAGKFAATLFTVGSVSVGFLAIPTLAGSAAYLRNGETNVWPPCLVWHLRSTGGTMLGMGVVGTIIVILVIVWLVRRVWSCQAKLAGLDSIKRLHSNPGLKRRSIARKGCAKCGWAESARKRLRIQIYARSLAEGRLFSFVRKELVENFLADMGERPPGKTPDRRDKNGNRGSVDRSLPNDYDHQFVSLWTRSRHNQAPTGIGTFLFQLAIVSSFLASALRCPTCSCRASLNSNRRMSISAGSVVATAFSHKILSRSSEGESTILSSITQQYLNPPPLDWSIVHSALGAASVFPFGVELDSAARLLSRNRIVWTGSLSHWLSGWVGLYRALRLAVHGIAGRAMLASLSARWRTLSCRLTQ